MEGENNDYTKQMLVRGACTILFFHLWDFFPEAGLINCRPGCGAGCG